MINKGSQIVCGVKGKAYPIFLSLLFLWILFTVSVVTPVFGEQTVQQKSTGDQSPVVKAGGDVNIEYHGISKQAFDELRASLEGKDKLRDRLLKNLDEMDIAIAERDATIKRWIKQYKELEARLEKRTAEDGLIRQAKEKLEDGDLEGAEQLLRESLEKNLKALGERRKAAAADAFELGSLKELQLFYVEAMDYYKQAVELESNNSDYLNKYGMILYNLANHTKAIEYYEKALKIDLAVFGEKHPEVATRYNNLGLAWSALGDYKKAIEYYTKALEINMAVFGEKHPHVAVTNSNLGMVWSELGDYKKAIDYYTKALEINMAVFGEKHPKVATRYNNLGSAWSDLGDNKKAIDYFTKSLEIFSEVYGSEHPNTKRARANIDAVKAD